jgi:AcrR family transcriptional regulator
MFSRPPPRSARASATPRSNVERTQTTRAALLAAAHQLFVERGFAATSTPDICAAAGLTRGALYHHWADKSDLLRAVLEREAAAVRAAIDSAAAPAASAQDALRLGADAYLAAMAERGRTRLLLVEGPAVLGLAETAALDAGHAAAALEQGLRAALRRDEAFTAALSNLLSATFDRAALDIDAGADPAATRKALRWVIERLLAA